MASKKYKLLSVKSIATSRHGMYTDVKREKGRIKMKKSLLKLISLVLLIALMLTSCDALLGGDTNTGNQNDGQQSGSADGSDEQKPSGSQDTGLRYEQIVIEHTDLDIEALRVAVFENVGAVGISTPNSVAKTREIVVGNTDRAVTLEAKAQLSALIAADSDADDGYIIYSDGNSVAAYWSKVNFEKLAISKLYDICVTEKNFNVEKGVHHYEVMSTKELEQESLWLDLRAEAPDDLYKALRKLNGMYDGTIMCEWLANLFDAEIGGFYYSNSARDNEPFRPDLESTYQAVGWIGGYGAASAYGGSVNLMFPNELKMQIVDFAKNMQCATDGYFYHPQWPQGTDKLNTDRYGRDLSWGVDLINRFTVDRDGDGVEEKQYPNYCTPSGAKCEAHAGSDDYCSFISAVSSVSTGLSAVSACSSSAITAGVQSSVSCAVSKIPSSTVRAVVSSKPDYSSSEAFSAWLAEYCSSIQEDSGNAHNINALQDEIIAKGFGDEVLDFLEKNQEEVYEAQVAAGVTPTGLWQKNIGYRLVWGVMKYMPFYNSATCGRAIKHPELIVASCMEVIMLPLASGVRMNDLMNQWSSITAVIQNVRNYYGERTLNDIYAMINERGAELVESCIEKLKSYRLEDGTFAYGTDGKSLSKIYGVPISLGAIEGDVNGNLLCSSYYNGMFSALGYKSVPLCTASDGELFLETISMLEPIEKIPADTAVTVDFERDADISYYSSVRINKYTDIGAIERVSDPLNPGNSAVRFTSGVGTQFGDYFVANSTGVFGNCNIIEFDFLLESASADTTLFQVRCGGYMFTISKSGQYLTFASLSGYGGDAHTETLATTANKINASEWNKIRFEVYEPESNGEQTYIKFFVNDNLLAISTLYFEKHLGKAYDPNITNVSFYSMMRVVTVNCFDNIYVSKEDKVLDLDDEDVSDARDK